MSGQPFQFETLHAVELDSARRNVQRFAEKLLHDQAKTWEENKAAGVQNKPRPATYTECLDKSRDIRIKRERDSSYWNDLLSSRPIH